MKPERNPCLPRPFSRGVPYLIYSHRGAANQSSSIRTPHLRRLVPSPPSKGNHINRITALFAVAITSLSGAAFAGTGLAGDITIETEPFASTTSRAEVRAELRLQEVRRQPLGQGLQPPRQLREQQVPAQVTAEYIANRDAVAALHGEDSGSRYLTEDAAARRAVRMASTGHEQ